MASFLPSALHHLAPPWSLPPVSPLPSALCLMRPSCPLTPGSAVTSGPCQRQLREAKQGRGRPGERPGAYLAHCGPAFLFLPAILFS